MDNAVNKRVFITFPLEVSIESLYERRDSAVPSSSWFRDSVENASIVASCSIEVTSLVLHSFNETHILCTTYSIVSFK